MLYIPIDFHIYACISLLLRFCDGKTLISFDLFSLDEMAAVSQTTYSSAFLWMKSFYFDSNFTEVCSQGSNWQHISIGSGNSLAPNRQQAITWTNAYTTDAYMRHLGDELTLIIHDFVTDTHSIIWLPQVPIENLNECWHINQIK